MARWRLKYTGAGVGRRLSVATFAVRVIAAINITRRAMNSKHLPPESGAEMAGQPGRCACAASPIGACIAATSFSLVRHASCAGVLDPAVVRFGVEQRSGMFWHSLERPPGCFPADRRNPGAFAPNLRQSFAAPHVLQRTLMCENAPHGCQSNHF